MVMNFPNMANNIIELENRQEHVNQLKAARRLYTKVGYFSFGGCHTTSINDSI